MSAGVAKKEVKTIWDIPLERLYPLVIEFYKSEKDRIVLDYEQRIRLLAFFKQEKLGAYSSEKDSETGYFDVVGSHRRKAWISLGSMSKEEARQSLIKLLDAATPLLRDTVLEKWRAEQRQLEKENCAQDEKDTKSVPPHSPSTPPKAPAPKPAVKTSAKSILAPAALWCTPKAARHFINQLSGSPEHRLTISPGESVTIQVPTSLQASAIFWEFVTEQGDIGFGVRYQRAAEGSEIYPIDELLPVTRRDCSEDLILGSHQYMNQGTYMLQFTNSHCSTSGKVVYYKVFYQTNTSSQ